MAKAWIWGWALLGAWAMAGSGEAAAAGAAPPRQVELPDTSPLIGGWAGRIGSYPVMVCFGTDGGSYLYASHPANPPLSLYAQDEGGGQWQEVHEQGADKQLTGRWELASAAGAAGAALQGKWTDAAGKRSLPIRLERVGEPGGCDFAALQQKAGLHPEAIVAGKEAVQGGIRYRTLSALDGSVTTIELIDAGGRYAALNRKLRQDLAQQIGEAESCQADASLRNGLLAWSYSSSIEPVSLRGAHWLTLRSGTSSYCGGAHPNDASVLYTVEVESGVPLDIGSWLKLDKEGALPPALDRMVGRQALAQRGGGDDECADVYGSDSAFPGYAMSLGTRGIVFQKDLPRVVLACSEDVEIPFPQLQPFLTGAGKAAVKALQQGAGSAGGKH